MPILDTQLRVFTEDLLRAQDPDPDPEGDAPVPPPAPPRLLPAGVRPAPPRCAGPRAGWSSCTRSAPQRPGPLHTALPRPRLPSSLGGWSSDPPWYATPLATSSTNHPSDSQFPGWGFLPMALLWSLLLASSGKNIYPFLLGPYLGVKTLYQVVVDFCQTFSQSLVPISTPTSGCVRAPTASQSCQNSVLPMFPILVGTL